MEQTTPRELLVSDGTSMLLAEMAKAIQHLDANRATWHSILAIAKADLEDTTRAAVFNSDNMYSMASPHWQQKIQVLLLRVEMLEQLCESLPLRDTDV